jgi:hypothetical protein
MHKKKNMKNSEYDCPQQNTHTPDAFIFVRLLLVVHMCLWLVEICKKRKEGRKKKKMFVFCFGCVFAHKHLYVCMFLCVCSFTIRHAIRNPLRLHRLQRHHLPVHTTLRILVVRLSLTFYIARQSHPSLRFGSLLSSRLPL